jgi:hypothetical protein
MTHLTIPLPSRPRPRLTGFGSATFLDCKCVVTDASRSPYEYYSTNIHVCYPRFFLAGGALLLLFGLSLASSNGCEYIPFHAEVNWIRFSSRWQADSYANNNRFIDRLVSTTNRWNRRDIGYFYRSTPFGIGYSCRGSNLRSDVRGMRSYSICILQRS